MKEISNREIAKILTHIAEILSVRGENPYKIRAYTRASQNIERLTYPLSSLKDWDELSKIPGIGEGLSKKITELLTTGKLSFYEELKKTEAAQKGALPKLIELEDIKGDLHIHSNWSDGIHSIEEMALAAQKKGYQYIAVCDHSSAVRIAGGLSEDRLCRQMEEIERLNRKFKGFRILKGIEVDIRSDGCLDFF